MKIKQSDSLRNRTEQHKVKNEVSKKQDKKILRVINKVINKLKQNYPNIEIVHEKQLPLSSIKEIIKLNYPDLKLETTRDKKVGKRRPTFITPDGGFIYAIIDDKKRYICISEEKTQGTNDKRLLEGKPRQALGNAVERLGKNYNGLEEIFASEGIFPFVTFLQGCDFHKDESNLSKNGYSSSYLHTRLYT